MQSLNIIENEEVTLLFNNNIQELNQYIQTELRKIRDSSESFQCQAADKALLALLPLIVLFKEFSPKLEEDFIEHVRLNNERRIEKLVSELKKRSFVWLTAMIKM